MKKGKIYKIVNKKNGLTYIGCTIYSLEKRFYEHIFRCFNSDYKSKLYNSIKKYGQENFKIELIEECDLNVIYETEKKYIEKYDTYNNGLNSTLGGEGCLGYIHNQETRKKISDNLINGKSHKGKKYDEIYGKNSEEEKNKRRLSVKNSWKNLTKEEKQKRLNKTKESIRDKSKYGSNIITDIKNKLKEGYKIKEIKEIYPQISASYLYAIKNNKRWIDTQ